MEVGEIEDGGLKASGMRSEQSGERPENLGNKVGESWDGGWNKLGIEAGKIVGLRSEEFQD